MRHHQAMVPQNVSLAARFAPKWWRIRTFLEQKKSMQNCYFSCRFSKMLQNEAHVAPFRGGADI